MFIKFIFNFLILFILFFILFLSCILPYYIFIEPYLRKE